MVDNNSANFIWNIADHLRGTYKATDYAKVVLPFTILRRMDCILADTHDAVVAAAEQFADKNPSLRDQLILSKTGGLKFYNSSPFTLTTLLDDAPNIEENLLSYIDSFSDSVKDIFTRFRLAEQVHNLQENDLLYLTVQKYASADFHPDTISNHEMGLLFEELIRKFAEDSAADNGEFFTPRDAIELLVRLLFAADEETLRNDEAPIRSIYDPTAGTGGMLSVASEWLESLNDNAELNLYGQELNPESYAICKSDMIAKGQDVNNIKLGNTLLSDLHENMKFDFVISNPPYGSKWEKEKTVVEAEHKNLGFDGRFGPGLPASSDGQLLFLLHAVSKLRSKEDGGGRAGVILNGSSLFSGDAGSGASNIRRWLFENDLVDTIVALPTNMFYSTGIATYIWLIDNNKPASRKGKVQLIDASAIFTKMRKSLGGKTRAFSDENIAEITNLYKTEFTEAVTDVNKIFASEDFGFKVVTVEQPLIGHYQWNTEAKNRFLEDARVQKWVEPKQVEIINALDVCNGLTYVVHSNRNLALSELNSLKITDEKTSKIRSLTKAEKDIIMDTLLDPVTRGNKGSVSYIDNNEGKGFYVDKELTDTETIPLSQDVNEYLEREVKPFAIGGLYAVDESKTKVGYEIPFNRHFYKAEVQRSLVEIQAELKAKIALITSLLGA